MQELVHDLVATAPVTAGLVQQVDGDIHAARAWIDGRGGDHGVKQSNVGVLPEVSSHGLCDSHSVASAIHAVDE